MDPRGFVPRPWIFRKIVRKGCGIPTKSQATGKLLLTSDIKGYGPSLNDSSKKCTNLGVHRVSCRLLFPILLVPRMRMHWPCLRGGRR
jgi:hypothetical protein